MVARSFDRLLSSAFLLFPCVALAQGTPPPPPQSAPAQGQAPPASPQRGAGAEPAPPPQQPPSQQPPPGYGPPPEYGPPPGYGTPPPGGYGRPPAGYGPPRYYYYPPPSRWPQGIERPFTIGGGIGFGAINTVTGGDRSGHLGLSYNFHIGFGIYRNLLILWDMEGASVSDNRDYGYGSEADQIAHLAALQWFPFGRHLFLKGGIGGATASSNFFVSPSNWGFAGMAGIGFELIQGWMFSFDVEATSTWVRYSDADQTWNNNGLNFVFNWF